PVLHVARFKRTALDTLIDGINATGYGLTFGVHTRIDETIAQVTQRIHAGNLYVNRNVIGAVVGVQPFGGEGLSGTGPKAGGPLYLLRLLATRPAGLPRIKGMPDAQPWTVTLPGPTGEHNTWSLLPRGTVLCVPATTEGAQAQWSVVKASGNRALFLDTPPARAFVQGLPAAASGAALVADAELDAAHFDAVLFEGDGDALLALNRRIAARDGALISVQGLSSAALLAGEQYVVERLLAERSVSVNTAAAGGNASLMTIG
ncbi:MAG: aldehyde dehydrogenase family protein, partial [Comamonadaceae bacterium]